MARPKILLLERTDAARDAMQQMLEGENCEVVSSGTFTEGLDQIYEQQDFDVLITNLRTQRAGDHPKLVAAIRAFQPECLLVAVSDALNEREARLAMRLQVDFIVKPSNVKEVPKLMYARMARCAPPPRAGAASS